MEDLNNSLDSIIVVSGTENASFATPSSSLSTRINCVDDDKTYQASNTHNSSSSSITEFSQLEKEIQKLRIQLNKSQEENICLKKSNQDLKIELAKLKTKQTKANQQEPTFLPTTPRLSTLKQWF